LPGSARLHELRAAVYRKQGRLAEAFAEVEAGLAANPTDEALAQEAAFNSNYPSGIDAACIAEAHRRFGALLVARTPRIAPRPPGPGDRDRPLRVAFMSPDFREHSVAYYAEPLIESLDRAAFEVWLYHTHGTKDAVTARFRGLAQGWCDAQSMSDEALAGRVALDRIDVLIDLAGLTGGARPGVLARKPAPVQVTYLGYPNTLGLSTVDARFIDGVTDPPTPGDEYERRAVERLVRLDPCFLCYRGAADAPAVAPPPMLASGRVTFGSFNAGMKLSERCVAMWSAVLRAVPGSRLLLKNFDLSLPEVQSRVRARLESAGVEGERVEVLGYTASPREHLALYARVDIGLDTFPYHGTTTTCEAFHMGVPVVTREGDLHAARVGCTLLRAVGLADLIARDDEAFVSIAAGLASDPARLGALRVSLRDRQAGGVLGDARAFADRFGAALRECWHRACEPAGRMRA
jgi:predicted O-linked N-acetylglucosamine transferase (SPINDLY family)